ncbi:MAG: YceI family protein [Bacteroidota bacterium]
MKRLNYILSLVAIIAFTFSANAQSFKIDNSASNVTWIGKKVTGSHNGNIKIKSGSLDFKNSQLSGGTIVIDMTTINTLDLTGQYKGDLEGHLKSDDFFGVSKFPTAKIVITKVVPQGPGKYKVTGDLTIKGTTKEIKFIANLDQSGNSLKGNADLTVDRSEYDIRYGSGSFFDNLGDKTIYDDFELSVNLVAKK